MTETNDQHKIEQMIASDPIVALAGDTARVAFYAGWDACLDTLKKAHQRLPSYSIEALIAFGEDVRESAKKQRAEQQP